MKAFILAGGKTNKDKLNGYENKALLPIKGKIMVQYIIDALKGSTYIDSIGIIGEPKELKKYIEIDENKDVYIQEDTKMVDNFIKGLDYFKEEENVLAITSDIPFITTQAIDHFIKESLDTKAKLTYPIIEKENQLKTFPDLKRTYLKLKDGTFTGGNMMLINPSIRKTIVPMARYMIHNRKKPWKMTQMLGLGFLLKLLLGRLTLEKIEERVSHLIKEKAKAIITPYAEVGNDIDRQEDIEKAKKYIRVSTE